VHLRTRIKVAVLALSLAASGAALACFTAPPPDLPAEQTSHPIIDELDTFPPAASLLTELPPPPGFVVPVVVGSGDSFQWNVFIDGNTSPSTARTVNNPILDAGANWVEFQLTPADFTFANCPHRIELFVAYQFDPASPRTPESFGGDSVAWLYEPEGCTTYDAGDGAFPPQDAPSDGLPVAPESGTDP
jgi:hypothetical protein